MPSRVEPCSDFGGGGREPRAWSREWSTPTAGAIVLTMTTVTDRPGGLVIQLPWSRPFTDDDVRAFQRLNPDLRTEVDAEGNLIVMAPAGSDSGRMNARAIRQLDQWAEREGSGLAFDSSAGFRLPVSSALRAPDAAWVRSERWQALTREQRKGFAPIAPDFVLELRSPTDSVSQLMDKMSEYLANGVRMGLLLDPDSRTVYAYREGEDKPETLQDPETVSCEPVLPGFSLDVRAVWQAGEA